MAAATAFDAAQGMLRLAEPAAAATGTDSSSPVTDLQQFLQSAKLPVGAQEALAKDIVATGAVHVVVTSMALRDTKKSALVSMSEDHTYKPLRNATADKKKCFACGIEAKRMPKCSGCYWARYCSRVCQKEDWKLHKNMCDPDAGVQPGGIDLSLKFTAHKLYDPDAGVP